MLTAEQKREKVRNLVELLKNGAVTIDIACVNYSSKPIGSIGTKTALHKHTLEFTSSDDTWMILGILDDTGLWTIEVFQKGVKSSFKKSGSEVLSVGEFWNGVQDLMLEFNSKTIEVETFTIDPAEEEREDLTDEKEVETEVGFESSEEFIDEVNRQAAEIAEEDKAAIDEILEDANEKEEG